MAADKAKAEKAAAANEDDESDGGFEDDEEFDETDDDTVGSAARTVASIRAEQQAVAQAAKDAGQYDNDFMDVMEVNAGDKVGVFTDDSMDPDTMRHGVVKEIVDDEMAKVEIDGKVEEVYLDFILHEDDVKNLLETQGEDEQFQQGSYCIVWCTHGLFLWCSRWYAAENCCVW